MNRTVSNSVSSSLHPFYNSIQPALMYKNQNKSNHQFIHVLADLCRCHCILAFTFCLTRTPFSFRLCASICVCPFIDPSMCTKCVGFRSLVHGMCVCSACWLLALSLSVCAQSSEGVVTPYDELGFPDIMNMIFVSLFTFECIFKIIAFGAVCIRECFCMFPLFGFARISPALIACMLSVELSAALRVSYKSSLTKPMVDDACLRVVNW